jgi:hypothetical protein
MRSADGVPSNAGAPAVAPVMATEPTSKGTVQEADSANDRDDD